MTMNDIAKEYFDKNYNITAQTLADFLAENEWRIYDHYDKLCKKTDIMLELKEREIKYSNKDVEDILDCYEGYLEDNDTWRDCLNKAIYDIMEE